MSPDQAVTSSMAPEGSQPTNPPTRVLAATTTAAPASNQAASEASTGVDAPVVATEPVAAEPLFASATVAPSETQALSSGAPGEEGLAQMTNKAAPSDPQSGWSGWLMKSLR